MLLFVWCPTTPLSARTIPAPPSSSSPPSCPPFFLSPSSPSHSPTPPRAVAFLPEDDPTRSFFLLSLVSTLAAVAASASSSAIFSDAAASAAFALASNAATCLPTIACRSLQASSTAATTPRTSTLFCPFCCWGAATAPEERGVLTPSPVTTPPPPPSPLPSPLSISGCANCAGEVGVGVFWHLKQAVLDAKLWARQLAQVQSPGRVVVTVRCC
mmetsp:Transcript_25491/g.51168  ORF Transcript_25491/g.51168 Transcript_25491/m.51168 type:complete len:214 (-) Transcript_25491:263-904(-)